MTKKTILFVGAFPPPYHGVSVSNEILVKNADINGRYTLKIIQLMRNELTAGGYFSFGTLFRDLMTTLKGIMYLLKKDVKLIYFVLSQTKLGLMRDSIWIWVAVLMGIKSLGHMHGGNFRDFYDSNLGTGLKWFLKLSLKRLDGVIVYPMLKDLFKNLITDGKIFVLSNGVPDPVSNEKDIMGATDLRKSIKKIRVAYLSNLIIGKGYDTLIESVVALKKRGYDNKFVVNLAGAFPTPEIGRKVNEFIRFHHIADTVKILGPVVGEEKWRLLLNSDVFVFPTRYLPEGQPFCIIEALAAGLPVITTARGSIPTLVREGINGFLVAENDPEGLADRLELLRSDRDLRFSMGKNSRNIFLANFTEERFVKGFIDILDEVIGN